MSPPTSPAAAKYLSGKAYILRRTTSTSATTSPPPPTQQPSASTSPQSQLPSASTSPPPIPARSPARVSAPAPAPAPALCPVVKTPVEPSKATAPAEKAPTWRQKLTAAAAAPPPPPPPPPISTTTSPLIPTLPPPSRQIDGRAWGDEDYPELIENDDEMEWEQHAQPVQQAGTRYFSFSSTPSLQTIPEENQESISTFAVAKSTARPGEWSATMPARPFLERDGEKTGEETEAVGKDHKALKKENLPVRKATVAKDEDEDEPGTKNDEEKRFI